ncbi:MAG: ABC transporter ATP-binding protein, partial [Clostridiales bacterium]|nr:ABC transporter ATP-binding protein [Clostridiales bacterium]
MEPMLDVSNLSFDYLSASSCLPVIDNISFQAFEGDFISIVGPSGCGKSTLLDIIAGLMPSSAGQVFFLGEPVIKPRKEIGYMLQRDQLFEWRSILRNTLLGPEIQHSSHKDKRKARKTASEMLTRYDLGGFLGAKPSELSGGMRQRVALIRTLAVDPDILLLDEPFSSLDFQTRLLVSNDIYQIIKQEHKSTILVTHDINEAVSMADTVYVLSPRPEAIKAIHTIKLTTSSPRTPML